MPRFRFALSSAEVTREVGIVQCESFQDAMTALTDRFDINVGDALEIGVAYFPPARFIFSETAAGELEAWRPAARMAA